MYVINVRYKIHYEVIDLFKREGDPVSMELYKMTDDILSSLENVAKGVAKNKNIYIFGEMKDVSRKSDLKDFEIRVIKKTFELLKEKVERLSKLHRVDLWTPNMEDYLYLLVAEYILAGNHYKLPENHNFVLLVMKNIIEDTEENAA